MKQYIFKISNP